MAEKTAPIYIDTARKNKVKKESVEREQSMKVLIQRLVEHGMANDLHTIPVEDEVEVDVETPFVETDNSQMSD